MLSFEEFKEKLQQKMGPTKMSDEQLDKLRISLYYFVGKIINDYVNSKPKKLTKTKWKNF